MKSKKEIIRPKDAFKNHKISTLHTKEETDEWRFRLTKEDEKTGYIRTEAAENGNWQQAHSHSKVLETYIVQKDWIRFITKNENKISYKAYRERDIFTTPSNITHNVYMSRGSVIHTIKHGDASEENRTVDDEFTTLSRTISEADLKDRIVTELFQTEASIALDNLTYENVSKESTSKSSPGISSPDPEMQYDEGYRHFDNLIWQVPAWSTGIFMAILLGTSNLKKEDVDYLTSIINISSSILLSSIYFLGFLFLSVLSYTLHRFRWHQVHTKSYKPKKCQKYRSPQIFLQFIVNIQFTILLFLSCSCVKSLWLKAIPAIIIFVFITYWEVSRIANKENKSNKLEYNGS